MRHSNKILLGFGILAAVALFFPANQTQALTCSSSFNTDQCYDPFKPWTYCNDSHSFNETADSYQYINWAGLGGMIDADDQVGYSATVNGTLAVNRSYPASVGCGDTAASMGWDGYYTVFNGVGSPNDSDTILFSLLVLQKRDEEPNAFWGNVPSTIFLTTCAGGEIVKSSTCQPIQASIGSDQTSCTSPCNFTISWNTVYGKNTRVTKNGVDWPSSPPGLSGSQAESLSTGTYTYNIYTQDGYGTESALLDSVTVTVSTAYTPVTCSPSSQTVQPNEDGGFIARDGNGSYTWSAPGGSPSSGSGSAFLTQYASAGNKIVTVSDGASSADCPITVLICSLTVNGSSGAITITAGGTATFVSTSNPSGKTFRWGGTNDGAPFSPIVGGTTDSTDPFVLATPATYTRHIEVESDGNTAACVSNTVTVTVIPATTPPGGFTLSPVGSGSSTYCSGVNSIVNLSWSASSGATAYEVYRNGVLITTVGVTTYEDYVSSATSYSYYIKATNTDGSTNSNTINATSADCTAPPACNSDSDCDDANSCTIDSCVNPGVPGAYCTNTNNPVDGGWSAWSACSGGVQTRTCDSPTATCGGGSCTGPSSQACGGPGSFTLSPASAFCSGASPRVSLSWSSSAGATSYTVNRTGGAAFTPVNVGTSLTYTDTSVVSGTLYTYTITASDGTTTTNSNSVASTPPSCVTVPPPPTTITTGVNFSTSGGAVACGQVRLRWTDNATNENGFYLYRKTTNTAPTLGGPASPDYLASTSTNASVYIYSPTPSGTPYYYWITAYNGSGESDPTLGAFGALSDTPCTSDLSSSDKDIVAINGANIGSGVGNQCGGTDVLPANTILKVADKIKFSINLCNSGAGIASAITVTDTLLNLKQPTGGWNIKYDSGSGESSTLPGGMSYAVSGTVPNQVITFSGVPNVPAGGSLPAIRRITFEAQIAVPPGYTGSSARFQNRFRIDYNGGMEQLTTPLLPFYSGQTPPTIVEVP